MYYMKRAQKDGPVSNVIKPCLEIQTYKATVTDENDITVATLTSTWLMRNTRAHILYLLDVIIIPCDDHKNKFSVRFWTWQVLLYFSLPHGFYLHHQPNLSNLCCKSENSKRRGEKTRTSTWVYIQTAPALSSPCLCLLLDHSACRPCPRSLLQHTPGGGSSLHTLHAGQNKNISVKAGQ